MRMAAFLLFAVHLPAAVHAQEETPAGVVVAVADIDADAALAAATKAGGARFRAARLAPAAIPAREPPVAAIGALRETYLAADFLRCVARLTDPSLSVDALLADGHREQAATAGVIAAACAFGAEDPGLARTLLARVAAAELDPSEALAVTSADFQAFAEEVRRETLARPRVRLTLASRPNHAEVRADGGAHRCTTPCALELLPGAHVVSVDRLGYGRRTVTPIVEETTELVLSLDPAPAAVVRRELAGALAGGRSPGDIELARAAATAWSARVVVMVYDERGRTTAALYDRGLDRVVARVSVTAADGPAPAVRAVVNEWRGVTEATPLRREPLFWLSIGAAAAVAGVIVFLALRPGDTQHDLVFGLR